MSRRAFTLIELMIAIALLAILMAASGLSHQGLGQLRREGDFRIALQTARQQLQAVEQSPFDSLPPQVLTVSRSGELQLGQQDIVPGTLRVTRLDGVGSPARVTAVEGSRAHLDPSFAGQRVVAEYEWFLPGRAEAELVEAGGRVALWNVPALRVERVRAVRGAELSPVSGWQLSPDRQSLVVPAALAGRAVLVDYLGSRVRNRARGRFLDEQLRELDSPSPLKLLEVLEDYGERAGALRLTTLRVSP